MNRFIIKKLAHIIIEAEKSQDLRSASWRPKRSVVWFHSEPEGLRTKRDDAVSSSPSLNPCPKAGVGTDTPAQRQSGRERILSHSAFSSIQAFQGLDHTHPYWEGPLTFLGPLIQALISSRNALTGTNGITLNQMSGYPLCEINPHN